MSGILESVFRHFSPDPVSRDAMFPDCNCVLVGNRDSSRCLLFLSAVTAATHLGLKVLFFTQTPFESLQVSLRGSVPGLRLEALKVTESGLRTGPLQDDLSPVAHVAALLHDTAAFLTQILHDRENQGPCRLIISFNPDSSETQAADLLHSVLERYLQVRCTLEDVRCDGETGEKECRVYLSSTCPLKDQQAVRTQQWGLVVRSSGAVEFRPVVEGEQEIRRDGDLTNLN